ncbi:MULTISPECIES: hypothetical protein [Citrobacter]|uniref:hypothetical protein n=1 Tax=Citrobacter TaxID=544 RepID=UPI00064317EB|nr:MULTISPECIES: hypothetical protein [Citrobacter]KLQ25751.1 hypothetical protein ABR34_04605 [Citrobacter braakii]MDM2831521.1 hypothetical protein [Citrobacter sp. Cpo085]MDM3346340.1 hypothetical protein [Citrobacter sp. Cf116]WFV38749.1 hypothetical protein NFJ31_09850 [Citrobacter freundii]
MKIEWKQVFLYALTPALIAGFFSVLPKLYDIAVEPKAELTYSVTNGPEIQASDSFQRIVSITIKNSGKRYLTKISADLSVNKGVVQAYKLYDLRGLEPKVSSLSDTLKIELQKMHPNEQFVISALLSSDTSNINPDFTLRSEEILGTITKDADSKKDNSISGGILAGIAVFIMSILFLGRFSKPVSYYKQDFMFYITARLGLPEISKVIGFDDSNVTYLRMADILLAHGLLCKDRSRFITALKSLLLIKNMASTSKEIVISNIKTLEGDKYDQDEINNLESKSIASVKIIDFRKLVDELAEKETIQTDC